MAAIAFQESFYNVQPKAHAHRSVSALQRPVEYSGIFIILLFSNNFRE
jgi:hypothetical protein